MKIFRFDFEVDNGARYENHTVLFAGETKKEILKKYKDYEEDLLYSVPGDISIKLKNIIPLNRKKFLYSTFNNPSKDRRVIFTLDRVVNPRGVNIDLESIIKWSMDETDKETICSYFLVKLADCRSMDSVKLLLEQFIDPKEFVIEEGVNLEEDNQIMIKFVDNYKIYFNKNYIS